MKFIKHNLKSSLAYLKTLIKWVVIAVVVGGIGAIVGSAFHQCIDFATHFRNKYPLLIFLLPHGGVVIAVFFRLFKSKGPIDTNCVIESARAEKTIPLIMTPLIFISSAITHLLGGSAGREGAALQLGGSIGYNIGKVFKLNKNDMHIIVMAGMSSVFAALFGTPLTAAFFAIEFISVGYILYTALIPCIIASVTAYSIALFAGISPVRFTIEFFELSPELLVSVLVLAILLSIIAILFCKAMKTSETVFKKLLPNAYIRGAIGGAIIVLLTLLAGTYDYNGAGMDVIERAIAGISAKPEAFILKIIFTAITISAGFKGGEIVPTFFIGSTFGFVAGNLLGLDPSFAASIGFVTLFCGVVNCPIASILLALEVFGSDNILVFALTSAICYLMSGNCSLYKSQKIIFSKLSPDFSDEDSNKKV